MTIVLGIMYCGCAGNSIYFFFCMPFECVSSSFSRNWPKNSVYSERLVVLTWPLKK